MKEPRVFQLVVMAVFGLLALVGLLMFASYSGRNAGSTSTGSVLIWGTLPKEAVEAGIAELAASNNDFDKLKYEEKDEAKLRRELADALASGSGPDLVIISQEDILAEAAKIQMIPFTTMPERTFVDSYLPLFELFLTEEGTYGIPLVADPLVLYYNRRILASENIPTPPTTWEAVAGLAPVVSERTDAGVITRSLIPFGEYTNVTNARAILSMLLLQSGTTISVKTDRGMESRLGSRMSVNDTGATSAESAISYYTQFGNPAKTVYSWNRSFPSSRDVFLAGDLALYPGFASELSYLLEANPNLDFDMAAMPQPGTAAAKHSFARGYAMVVTKASDNQVGAQNAAIALSGAGPSKTIAQMLGMAPARRALLVPPENDRYAAVYYPEALIADGWLSPAPPETDTVFASLIGNISSGRLDVISALLSAGSALDALYRD